jgi:hypothetical protein
MKCFRILNSSFLRLIVRCAANELRNHFSRLRSILSNSFLSLSEADARALLSPHGLWEFEVDHLRQSRPSKQEEINENAGRSDNNDHIERLLSFAYKGSCPDLTLAKWNSLRNDNHGSRNRSSRL